MKVKPQPDVILYTDGACSGNPGPGGWAYILVHPKSGKEKEGFGGEPETTNNRMELQAVIEGLKALKQKGVRVNVVTDSSYVEQGITQWVKGWKRNNWKRKVRNHFEPLKNVEYWKELDALVQQHRVTFERVRGHSGHEENERCDELAVAAYQKYLK